MRRSKDEMSAGVARMSDTGPGKPYWKRPEGLTGGIKPFVGFKGEPGRGEPADSTGVALSTDDVDGCGEAMDVVELGLWRKENHAADAAAPEAALAAAIKAKVAFDMRKVALQLLCRICKNQREDNM